MGDTKRVVNTAFWNDRVVSDDFSPEDKYFYLYLLTNPHTTQLGIYELPISKASQEMGYTREAIKVLLDRFQNKYKMIRYSEETAEVAIKYYLSHSVIKGGKPVFDCLKKDLQILNIDCKDTATGFQRPACACLGLKKELDEFKSNFTKIKNNVEELCGAMDKVTNVNNIKKDTYKKAEFYIKKYLGEVSLHFNLEKKEINKILYRILKQKDTTKKWWQFFIKFV